MADVMVQSMEARSSEEWASENLTGSAKTWIPQAQP